MFRVGFDVDGVLADTHGAVYEYMLREGWIGEGFHPDSLLANWDYGQTVPGFTSEHAMQMFGCPVFNRSIRPTRLLTEVLNVLGCMNPFMLFLLTARPANQLRLTEEWIRMNGGTFTVLLRADSEHKVDCALVNGFDLMVEDKPETAIAMAEAGITTILIRYPFTASYEEELEPWLRLGRIRCVDIDEVSVGMIHQILKEKRGWRIG